MKASLEPAFIDYLVKSLRLGMPNMGAIASKLGALQSGAFPDSDDWK
ncbi:hypothetical protein [Nostoc sp.]